MKLAIFYHIGQIGLGAFIYQSQIHRLYASGLIKEADYIHFGVNGDQELFNVPEKVIVKRNTNWKEETETLISLKNFAQENPDYKILYFHTKGASKGTVESQSWRLMMEYFVIDKWKECVEYLNTYDCVGQTWLVLGDTIWENGIITPNTDNVGHYPGNFWWANASYINRLNDKYLESNYRLDREFWIGSGKNYKAKSLETWNKDFSYQLHNAQIDLVNHYFKEEDYIK
jgi:hypothetical protein